MNSIPKSRSVSDDCRFSQILHPRWCSLDDYSLLQQKKDAKGFSIIAADLGRSRISVEQRYHRLTKVHGIEDLLLRYGLSDVPYDPNAPVNLSPLEAAS